MTNQEIAENVLNSCGGIATFADLSAAGVSHRGLEDLLKNGFLMRLVRGYYQAADNTSIPDVRYLSLFFPEAIVCMESALLYYGYTDFDPHIWTLARPRSKYNNRRRFDPVPMKTYFVPDDLLDIGRTTALFDGVELPIYDRDRTICGYFKNRSTIDPPIFEKAVSSYQADDRKNPDNLFRYAEQIGVREKDLLLMHSIVDS